MAKRFLKCVSKSEKHIGYAFDCPGCGGYHFINTEQGTGKPSWTVVDGDTERPFVSPSLKVQWHFEGIDKVCHFTITDGLITFCPDSSHELSGKTVTLPIVD